MPRAAARLGLKISHQVAAGATQTAVLPSPANAGGVTRPGGRRRYEPLCPSIRKLGLNPARPWPEAVEEEGIAPGRGEGGSAHAAQFPGRHLQDQATPERERAEAGQREGPERYGERDMAAMGVRASVDELGRGRRHHRDHHRGQSRGEAPKQVEQERPDAGDHEVPHLGAEQGHPHRTQTQIESEEPRPRPVHRGQSVGKTHETQKGQQPDAKDLPSEAAAEKG